MTNSPSSVAGSDSGPRWIPQLDAVRALACLMVLVTHLDSIAGFPALPAETGPTGVGIFFALSGFLITRSLISGPVRLDAFFNKRAARILPPYLLMLAVISAIGYRKEILWCATFAFNYLFLSGSQEYFHVQQTVDAPPPVAHLWSICVEEHYYWMWPFVLLLCSRRVASLFLSSIVLLTPLVARSLVRSFEARDLNPDAIAGLLSRMTLTQGTAIALGSLLALQESFWMKPVKVSGWNVPRAAIAGAAAVVLGLTAQAALQAGHLATPGQRLFLNASLQHLWSAGLMAVGLGCPWLGRVPLLCWLGRISYGLYLYHLPVYVLFGLARGGRSEPWSSGVLAVSVTVALAALSWHFYEHPLIRLCRTPPATSRPLRRRFGMLLSGTMATLFVCMLFAHRTQQPLASLFGLLPEIPVEWRRQELSLQGTAVDGYRWLGIEHFWDPEGFRRTTPFPAKTPETRRILTVGDSYTWGACVQDSETFSAMLEKRLRSSGQAVEVLNCGKQGGQAEDALDTLVSQLPILRPDQVLYAATLSDFLPRNVEWAGHDISEWRLPENQDRFRRAVQQMQAACAGSRADFLMFVFCQYPGDPASADRVRLIQRLGQQAGVRVVPVDGFLQHYSQRSFTVYEPFDDHPTAECHRIYADILAEYLQRPPKSP